MKLKTVIIMRRKFRTRTGVVNDIQSLFDIEREPVLTIFGIKEYNMQIYSNTKISRCKKIDFGISISNYKLM